TAPNSGAVHEEQKGSSTVPTGETLDLVDYDEEKESFITPPEVANTLASNGDRASAMDES
ncbi:hypothetical protein BGZ93_004520, partial [Podila epicladia]